MKLTYPFIFVFLLALPSCIHKPYYRAMDFQWRGVFASDPLQPNTLFSLLGKNAFTARKTYAASEFIRQWIAQHPRAQVVPVYSQKGLSELGAADEFIFCWLLDPKTQESLNLSLVQAGFFSTRDMEHPAGGDFRLHVSQAVYDEFLSQARLGEIDAFEKNQGIWKE